ncbi:MAG: hypothetical protein ACXVHN_04650 [Methanobacterium sp.]
MEISIEQCKENDLIKRVISNSGLPIKLIKFLLRISDTIYINSINYNVIIENDGAILLLISSKPENKTGIFNTYSLANVLQKLRDMDKENDNINSRIILEENTIQIKVDATD